MWSLGIKKAAPHTWKATSHLCFKTPLWYFDTKILFISHYTHSSDFLISCIFSIVALNLLYRFKKQEKKLREVTTTNCFVDNRGWGGVF